MMDAPAHSRETAPGTVSPQVAAPAAPPAPPLNPAVDAPTPLTMIPLDKEGTPSSASAPPVVAVGDDSVAGLKGGGGFASGLCAGFLACCCLDACF